jgi:hypothetical protein
MNVREISRIPTKLKIVTGIYVLQVDRVKFKQNVERGIIPVTIFNFVGILLISLTFIVLVLTIG